MLNPLTTSLNFVSCFLDSPQCNNLVGSVISLLVLLAYYDVVLKFNHQLNDRLTSHSDRRILMDDKLLRLLTLCFSMIGSTVWYSSIQADVIEEDKNIVVEQLEKAIANAEYSIENREFLKKKITRSIFTHGVKNNEPIDTIVSISQRYGKMFFFTELRDLKGETIKHRWEHNGKVMAEVNFTIKSPRWRVYSSKNISPKWTGEWTVVVTDATGLALTRNTILVVN